MQSVEYIDKIGKVAVGELYDSVIFGGEKLQMGDIVSFNDPDSAYYPENNQDVYQSMSVTTGVIDRIYKRDNPEVSIKGASLGRLDVSDLEIPGDRVDKFLSADTENSITETWYAIDPSSEYEHVNEAGFPSYELTEN